MNPDDSVLDPQEPTKQRAGDQPLPTVSDRPDIQSLVIEDIAMRRKIGIQRYGTPLQAFNGRNTLQDAYEEALDLTMYLRAVLEMGDAKKAELLTFSPP